MKPKPESNVDMLARLVKEFAGQLDNDVILMGVVVVALDPDDASFSVYRLIGDTMDDPIGRDRIADAIAESFKRGDPSTVRAVKGYKR